MLIVDGAHTGTPAVSRPAIPEYGRAFLCHGAAETCSELSTKRFSPDGRRLADASGETCDYEFCVLRFSESPAGREQLCANGGAQPLWRDDGRKLYYPATEGNMMAAPVYTSGSTIVARVPWVFSPAPLCRATPTPRFTVTGDGRRFLMAQPTEDNQGIEITAVLNWQAEVEG